MVDEKPVSVVIDPVCGMSLNRIDEPVSEEHEGHIYHFCGVRCAGEFRAHPEHYMKPRDVVSAAPVHGREGGEVEYTCPMHPQIVRSSPGACPICGMTLVS